MSRQVAGVFITRMFNFLEPKNKHNNLLSVEFINFKFKEDENIRQV